jgi:hypothetical protein
VKPYFLLTLVLFALSLDAMGFPRLYAMAVLMAVIAVLIHHAVTR